MRTLDNNQFDRPNDHRTSVPGSELDRWFHGWTQPLDEEGNVHGLLRRIPGGQWWQRQDLELLIMTTATGCQLTAGSNSHTRLTAKTVIYSKVSLFTFCQITRLSAVCLLTANVFCWCEPDKDAGTDTGTWNCSVTYKFVEWCNSLNKKASICWQDSALPISIAISVSVHLFYDIQWKWIRGIPFIVKSHNNRQNKSKCIF